MTDVWLPGFPIHQFKAGATYDETRHPKLGWHTWEGLSWSAAETAFRSYPPHIGCKPPHPGVPASEVGKRQYVPLNRHAYAFAGSENDDEYIIQVEVAGRAAEASSWTDQVCEWLYLEIVEPLEKAVGIPPIIVPGGFYDTTNYRPKVGTNYLGSARSEIRLTADELRAFTGHLGHQHMPAPDQHWDPGRLPIDRILAHRQEDTDTMTPDQEQLLRRVHDALGLAGLPDAKTKRNIVGRVDALYAKSLLEDDDVDEAKVAELVLAGLDPATIAAAIPADIADKVADELATRLGG